MSNWRYTAIDKLKEVENVQTIGFIAIPKILQFKRKSQPDVKGCVEAYSEQEATEMANRQIKRLYPYCILQSIYEERK